MTDFQQKKMERARKKFVFSKNKIDFPKKWSERRSTIFFLTDSPQKGSEWKINFFFQRKKYNIDVIFRLGKKIGVSKQKWSGEIQKKNWCFQKKREQRNIFFLNKKFQAQ